MVSSQYLSGQNICLVPLTTLSKARDKDAKFGLQALIPLAGGAMRRSARRATQDKRTNLAVLGELDKNLPSLDTEVYGSTNIGHTHALVTVCNNLILFVANLCKYNIHKTCDKDDNDDSEVEHEESPVNTNKFNYPVSTLKLKTINFTIVAFKNHSTQTLHWPIIDHKVHHLY